MKGDDRGSAFPPKPAPLHLEPRNIESAGNTSVTIDVTGKAVAKIAIGLFALAVVGSFLDRMRDVFVWIFAATFLAIALNPLVERLEPRIGRRPAATVVFLGFVIGFLAVLAALVAPFVTQVNQLTTGLPKAIAAAKHDSTI